MILYKIKKAFRRFLKSIHNFILLFGVYISFVKKKVINSAIEHNIYDSLENTYDIIFCTEVLEYLINPEDALKNLISAMKPGGYLFLTVPNGRIDDFEGHINFRGPESWNIFVQKQAQEYKVETGDIHERNLFALIFIQ